MAKKNQKKNKEIVQEQTQQLQAQNHVEALRENDENTAPPREKKDKKSKKNK